MEDNEIRKELLASQLEFLLIEMTDKFFKWKQECGANGWYNMPRKDAKNFFQEYIVSSAKKAIEVYRK